MRFWNRKDSVVFQSSSGLQSDLIPDGSMTSGSSRNSRRRSTININIGSLRSFSETRTVVNVLRI